MLHSSTTFRTILLLSGLALGCTVAPWLVTPPESAAVLVQCAEVDCPVPPSDGRTHGMTYHWEHPVPAPTPIYDAGAE